MRRIWRNALLLASLGLNIGFVSTFVFHKFRYGQQRSFPDLQMSPQAKAQFDANFSAFRGRMDALDQELHAERARLMDLLATESPSPEAIHTQQEKISAVNDRILQTFTDHLLNQKRLLQPQEQRHFFDFVQHHHERDRRSLQSIEEKHP